MVTTILLTRTDEQNRAFEVYLRNRNNVSGHVSGDMPGNVPGELSVLSRPLMKAIPIDIGETHKKKILDLDLFDHLIFVSQNAVRFGLPLLESYWPQCFAVK